jgi:hypothetical protein
MSMLCSVKGIVYLVVLVLSVCVGVLVSRTRAPVHEQKIVEQALRELDTSQPLRPGKVQQMETGKGDLSTSP